MYLLYIFCFIIWIFKYFCSAVLYIFFSDEIQMIHRIDFSNEKSTIYFGLKVAKCENFRVVPFENWINYAGKINISVVNTWAWKFLTDLHWGLFDILILWWVLLWSSLFFLFPFLWFYVEWEPFDLISLISRCIFNFHRIFSAQIVNFPLCHSNSHVNWKQLWQKI